MRFTNVKVKRDTNTVYNRSVPEWEVPVLEFIFEDGNVERLGTFGEVARDYPAPAVEFDRLVRSYGADPQSGIPYVASVYGQASAGVRALGRAIEEAKADDAKAAPKHLIEADPLTA
jgi:hypothetical protein